MRFESSEVDKLSKPIRYLLYELVDPLRLAFELGRVWADHLDQLGHVWARSCAELGEALQAAEDERFTPSVGAQELQHGHRQFYGHVVEHLISNTF